MTMRGLRGARLLALLIPAVLLGGAWGFQLIGGLYPCEMCHWQRWPHYGALVFAALAFVTGGPRGKATLVALLGPEAARAKLAEAEQAALDALAPFGERAAVLVEAARFAASRAH